MSEKLSKETKLKLLDISIRQYEEALKQRKELIEKAEKMLTIHIEAEILIKFLLSTLKQTKGVMLC